MGIKVTNYGYKIIIFNNSLYHEIELKEEQKKSVRIGTTKDCTLRFNKDMFFTDIDIEVRNTGSWQIISNNSVYFTKDHIMKYSILNLSHGDEIDVKYPDNNLSIFRICFFYNFDSMVTEYNCKIDIRNHEHIEIGGTKDCDIVIKDALVGTDSFVIQRTKNNTLQLLLNQTKYGIMHNGKKIENTVAFQSYDFVMLAGFHFYYYEGYLYTHQCDAIEIKQLDVIPIKETNNIFVYPDFNRSTRMQVKLPEEVIKILDPQPKKEKPKRGVIMTIAPVLISLALVIVFRGLMGSGGTFVYYSIAMMSMSTIITMINFVSERKNYRKQEKKRVEDYKKYIEEKEVYIREMRVLEKECLEEKYSVLSEEIQFVKEFDKRLFERSYRDEDFLTLRYGTGTTESRCHIDYQQQEFKNTEDELASIPEEVAAKYRFIENVPIVSEWKEVMAIGVVGSIDNCYSFVKTMTLDITIRHFFKEVKVAYIIDDSMKSLFLWVRWLQNVWNDVTGLREIISGEDDKNAYLEYLYSLLSKREETSGAEKVHLPHIIVFVFDMEKIKKHPIMRYIEEMESYGVTFVFCSQYEEMLPAGCKEIIRLQSGNEAEVVDSVDKRNTSTFSFEVVDDQIAEEVAIKLSPVKVNEVSLEGTLTKNITLYKLLNIKSAVDLDLLKRWQGSMIYKTMAAPLGVRAGNEVVYLDLNEKHHGPHGLVAGTTGSGKSEILQTYILSMATLFHPYEVGFVIIDFKGGGMVNQFKDLPHLNGAITNIDGREIDRSLQSIRAELIKRQELFTEAGVNHIDLYIKKYKNGECSKPLPHLILIVDEFAELKSDQPEFMKELISTARIGRSLGVHLILATQKPSGVVNDQIWSNSKFKLCLKVQNKEDSKEVLKSPLAAEIKEPGRAYLQVGNNEIFELFQSAYSGALTSSEEIGNVKPFSIYTVALNGKRTKVFEQKAKKVETGGETQLEAIVNYIHDYCEEEGIERLPGICLPPLQDVILYSNRANKKFTSTDIIAPLGMFDDPQHQMQEEYTLNVSQNNTFILGASQYGKTNILQVIIRGIASTYTPKEVNFYILDFASLILRNFAKLNHVGGIIAPNEEEKLKNFMKMMNTEITQRKELLAKLGISSFTAYRDAGYRELPQIIIMIDNFVAFRELAPSYDENMLYLCREGGSIGIAIIVTSTQTTGISYKYMSNFSKRIALYCNDSSSYGALFERCRMQPRDRAGSGLVEINRIMYELQSYLSFEGEKEIDRVEKINKFIEDRNGMYPNQKAKILPEIPTLLEQEYLDINYPQAGMKPYEIKAALDFDTIDAWSLHLLGMGVFSISGGKQSGKKNFLRIVFLYLQAHLFEYPSRVYILDNMNRKLKEFKQYGITEEYSIDANDIEEFLQKGKEVMNQRVELMKEEGLEVLNDEPYYLYVISNQEVINVMGQRREATAMYKEIVTNGKDLKIGFIFVDIYNGPISYSSPEVLKMLKETRNSIVFDNISNIKLYDIPMNVAKQFKNELSPGDAYYFSDNDIRKLKTMFVPVK